MRTFVGLVAFASFVLAGAACSEDEAASVPWEDYSPVVKERIDTAAAEEDCATLQAEFDQADANNDATMARTGHNNADLMAYIDEALREAGCYES